MLTAPKNHVPVPVSPQNSSLWSESSLHYRAPRTLFQDFLRSHIPFSAQNVYDLRCAETALTSSHPCSQTFLETVDIMGRQRRIKYRKNITLCYSFTSAYSIAVRRIFCQQLCLYFRGCLEKQRFRSVYRVKFLISLTLKPSILKQLYYFLNEIR